MRTNTMILIGAALLVIGHGSVLTTPRVAYANNAGNPDVKAG